MTGEALPTGTRRRWVPLVLFVLALGAFLPTVATGYVVTDSHASAVTAWRIATTGTPWLDGVDTASLEGTRFPEMWLTQGAGGHTVNARMPGTILPAVPFYAILNKTSDPAHFQIWVGGVSASFVAAAAGVLLFLTLRGRFGDGTSFAASGAFLLATPVWSVNANALWTHNLTLLGVALAMYFSSRERWWLAGLSIALAIISRPHLAVIAAVLGLYVAWKRREALIVAAVGLTSASGLVALSAWNKIVFDTWSVVGGYAGGVVEKLESSPGSGALYYFANTVGFLFGPDRGLFIWTPVIFLLLPSMLAHWGQLPDWVRALVLGGVVYSVLQLRVQEFTGGQGFYGYRYALELLLCLTPALVYAFRAGARITRIAVGVFLGVQIAVISVGAVNEDYYVVMEETWTSNSFLIALSDHPLAMGGLVVVAGAAGGLGMLFAQRRAGWRRWPDCPAEEARKPVVVAD